MTDLHCRVRKTPGGYTLTKGSGGTLELTPGEAQSIVDQLRLLADGETATGWCVTCGHAKAHHIPGMAMPKVGVCAHYTPPIAEERQSR